MKPSVKAFEREEIDILADYDAGLISEYDKNKAIKELWKDYREQSRTYRESLDDYDINDLDEY